MDKQGLCSFCGKPNVMYTCPMCGRNTCYECYDFNKGACRICSARLN